MHKTSKKTLAAAVAASLLLAAGGAAAQKSDLLSIYRDALANDPVYASARFANQAAREREPQARSALLPNVGASVGYNQIWQDSSTPNVSNSFNSWGPSLQLTMPIYRPQNWDALSQARLAVQSSEAQLAQARQDLILRVTQAYLDVLAAQDALTAIEASKKATAEQLAQARREFEVGTKTIVDTHEAQARFDLATAQEIAAQNDLEIKRRALHTLTGKDMNTLAALVPSPALATPAPASMDEWVNRSQSDNLQVRIGQQAKLIADMEIERARRGHHPTLDLTASYSDNNNQNVGVGTIDSKATVVGLEFALPLYQGGLVSSQVREAVANQDKARQQLEEALRSAALQTRQAYLNVTSTEAQVKALEAALASSQKSLESTLLGLEVGVRTNVDVLNAQQQLTSARRDLAAARYNFLLSVLNLKAAAGALTATDLEDIDRLLVAAR